jgi:hypothetical protein
MPKLRSPKYAFRTRLICEFRGPLFLHLYWLLVDDKVCKKRTRYDGCRGLPGFFRICMRIAVRTWIANTQHGTVFCRFELNEILCGSPGKYD